jgi:hypothetical protein
MEDIVIVTMITVLYGVNTVALVAVLSRVTKLEIEMARICERCKFLCEEKHD